MGARGFSRLRAPFLHGAKFPVLELFARGDIRRHSGQLSRALCVRFVRPCPRRTADRFGRPRASMRSARRWPIRRDFARAGGQPAGVARRRRQGVRRARRRSSSSTRSPPISSASSPATAARTSSKPVIRAFRRLAADHRGETTAEVVTARPLDDDQIDAAEAAASRPRRPRRRHRRHGRPRDPRRNRRQAGQPADRRLDPHQTQPSRIMR